MTRYSVNATLVASAWIEVEADSPEHAVQVAADYPTSAFEYDLGGADVEFNVSPAAEPVA